MAAMWNPWREMSSLRRELDRVFDDYWPASWPRLRSAFLPGRAARGYPLVNVYEEPDHVTVEGLAPGLDPDSVDVSVQENVLTLSGEKKSLDDVPGEAFHRSERAAGKFVRTIRLDTDVDVENVDASYENGILTVTLPKSQKAKPKQIEVKVS